MSDKIKYKELLIYEQEIIAIIREYVLYNKFGHLKITFNNGNIDLEQNHKIRLIK